MHIIMCIYVRPLVFQKYKASILKDVSLAEAAKSGTLTEFAYFDKVFYSQHLILQFVQS